MGYDGSTGTHNSFLFVSSAEVAHGRKTITQMNVPQAGVTRGRLVQHKQDWMKRLVTYTPTKTPGLSSSIRNGTTDSTSTLPSQTERLRDVYGVAQLPYSTGLSHGH
jgi:hypothetical protein